MSDEESNDNRIDAQGNDSVEDATKVFYDLCLKQYALTENKTELIYSRAGFVLTLLSLLGTGAFKLTRTDLPPLGHCCLTFWENGFILAYYLDIIGIVISLGFSFVFAIKYLMPKKNYEDLQSMKTWNDWLTDSKDTTDKELMGHLTESLAGIHDTNSTNNQKRNDCFRCFLISISFLITLIAVQTVIFTIFKLKGI